MTENKLKCRVCSRELRSYDECKRGICKDCELTILLKNCLNKELILELKKRYKKELKRIENILKNPLPFEWQEELEMKRKDILAEITFLHRLGQRLNKYGKKYRYMVCGNGYLRDFLRFFNGKIVRLDCLQKNKKRR